MEKVFCDVFSNVRSIHGRLFTKFIHFHQTSLCCQCFLSSSCFIVSFGSTILVIRFYNFKIFVRRQRLELSQSIFSQSDALVTRKDSFVERNFIIFVFLFLSVIFRFERQMRYQRHIRIRSCVFYQLICSIRFDSTPINNVRTLMDSFF